jgi:hypothetical protein
MGRTRRFAIFVIVAIVALAVVYAGWRVYRRAQPEQCFACQRSIHVHSRTVATARGSSRLFCCPACALSEQRQEGRPVRVTELTAFLTGSSLSPSDAYVVRGSDVNMCLETHKLIDTSRTPDRRPADLDYDRCAPSLLAFAQEREAIQFSQEHGGTVLPFREVAAAFAK